MSVSDLLSNVEKIAKEVVGPQAADVDKQARFPVEGIEALKKAGVMAAAIPTDLGGAGCNMSQLFEMCNVLGRHCTSTSMIVAMHHIQVVSLVNHAAKSEAVRTYLKRVVDERRLISSGTSEVGPSGHMRASVAHVETSDSGFSVTKQCTTVSYGQHAQDILFQARRNADSAEGDQVTVLGIEGGYTLEQKGEWDTLGMRGTCSPGGVLSVTGEPWQVLDAPFADVCAQTMTPVSHILWSGCWLGAAEDCVNKAASVVRAKAKKTPGQVPPDAQLLSRLTGKLQLFRSVVKTLLDEYTDAMEGDGDRGSLESLGFALRDNNLKLNSSHLAVDIITDALRIGGIFAYKNGTEISMGRQLRDVHSAALMVNNNRIHATNASMLLVHKNV